MTAWKPTNPGRLSSVFDILDTLREALQWVTDPDVRERAEALLLREGWCDDLEEMGARLMADEAAQPPTIDANTMSACVAFVHHMGGTSGLTDGEQHVLLRCAEMMPSAVAGAMTRKAGDEPKRCGPECDGYIHLGCGPDGGHIWCPVNISNHRSCRQHMWTLPEGITACWQTYGHPERWGVYAWLGDNDGFLFTEKLGRDIPGLKGDAVWRLKSLIARRNIEDPPRSQK